MSMFVPEIQLYNESVFFEKYKSAKIQLYSTNFDAMGWTNLRIQCFDGEIVWTLYYIISRQEAYDEHKKKVDEIIKLKVRNVYPDAIEGVFTNLVLIAKDGEYKNIYKYP